MSYIYDEVKVLELSWPFINQRLPKENKWRGKNQSKVPKKAYVWLSSESFINLELVSNWSTTVVKTDKSFHLLLLYFKVAKYHIANHDRRMSQ